MRRFVQCIMLLMLSSLADDRTVCAQGPDTVHTVLGERLVGKVLRLRDGVLNMASDAMGVVGVQWPKVTGMHCSATWRMRTRDGSLRNGVLHLPHGSGKAQFVSDGDTIYVALADIVELTALKDGSWSRIDGTATVGVNHQQANRLTQLVLGLNAAHRGEKGAWDIVLNSITTTLPALPDNRRQDGMLLREQVLHRRWSAAASIGGEANTELLLAARWKANAMLGLRAVTSSQLELLLLAGIQANNERSRSGTERSSSELLAGQRLRLRIPQAPKLELTMDVYTTYGLSISDRIRLQADAKLRYSVLKSMTIGIDLFEQYDGRPLDGDAPLNDYRLAGTVGFTF